MIVYSDVINHQVNFDLENISPTDKEYKYLFKHLLQKLGQTERRLVKKYLMETFFKENHNSESFFNKIRYRKIDSAYEKGNIMLSVDLEEEEIKSIEEFFKIESLLTEHYKEKVQA